MLIKLTSNKSLNLTLISSYTRTSYRRHSKIVFSLTDRYMYLIYKSSKGYFSASLPWTNKLREPRTQLPKWKKYEINGRWKKIYETHNDIESYIYNPKLTVTFPSILLLTDYLTSGLILFSKNLKIFHVSGEIKTSASFYQMAFLYSASVTADCARNNHQYAYNIF